MSDPVEHVVTVPWDSTPMVETIAAELARHFANVDILSPFGMERHYTIRATNPVEEAS